MDENRKIPLLIICYTLAILIVVFNDQLLSFLSNAISPRVNEHRLLVTWLLVWFSFLPLVLIRYITRKLWFSFIAFPIFGYIFNANGW